MEARGKDRGECGSHVLSSAVEQTEEAEPEAVAEVDTHFWMDNDDALHAAPPSFEMKSERPVKAEIRRMKSARCDRVKAIACGTLLILNHSRKMRMALSQSIAE